MKRLAAVLVAGALIVGLAGCSSSRFDEETQTYEDGSGPGSVEGEYGGSLYESTITLKDGRTITCIVFADNKKGGLSCDWDTANQKESE